MTQIYGPSDNSNFPHYLIYLSIVAFSLQDELKGLSKVEKVLLDTADSVMDTKKKIEFGVKQIMYKIGELVKLRCGHFPKLIQFILRMIFLLKAEEDTFALGSTFYLRTKDTCK